MYVRENIYDEIVRERKSQKDRDESKLLYYGKNSLKHRKNDYISDRYSNRSKNKNHNHNRDFCRPGLNNQDLYINTKDKRYYNKSDKLNSDVMKCVDDIDERTKLRPRFRYYKSYIYQNQKIDLQARKYVNRNKNMKTIEYRPNSDLHDYLSLGIGSPNNASSNSIHHFTEEYYLSYLTRDYNFSLTHNDLLSIEKNHVSIVMDKVNEYLIKLDKNLELERIEVIDHVIYKNKYFIFAFSKVYLISKMHYTTDSKNVYTTELVAFSKYPDTKEISEMITNVSKIIYDSLIEQNLDINARLINSSYEPENNNFMTKIINNKYDTKILPIKNNEIKKEYYPFIDVDILINTFLSYKEKLLLLYGKTGSGKTKLSSLIANSMGNKGYDIVSVDGTTLLNKESFDALEEIIYSYPEKERSLCIIIDDLDPMVLNRDTNANNINTIFNKFLTILDGNYDLPIKVIITSNHIIKEDADEPLYRAGRLFDSVYIRYLTKDEAKSILKENKISKTNIDKFISNYEKDISQADVAKFISSTINYKQFKSYYKDKTVESKIIQKRIGLL